MKGNNRAILITQKRHKNFSVGKGKGRYQKEVSFHRLRHRFATHLPEKGVDIQYIQELLGHFDIKTTTRYLHVMREQLVNITSPPDDLWEKGLKDA